MAAISLLIMVGLLIARSVVARLSSRRAAERTRLIALLLGESDLPAGAVRAHGIPRKLLTSLSVELIQLVRGEDRARFIATATTMGVPERLRHQLDRGSARARLAAAEALGHFPDAKSLQRLRLALEDRNPDVRIAAALSLAEAGEAPSGAEIIYRLGIGSRENSLLAVSLFHDIAEQRPDELKTLLVDENIPPGAKAAVIESLAVSGDYTLVPLIVSLARQEEDPQHLTRYVRALGKFGHPAAEPAIKRGLQSRYWEVRSSAARATGRIGLAALAPNLKQLLGDPEWWVRFRAGQALALLAPAGVEYLREVASSGSEPARTAASSIMAERGLK